MSILKTSSKGALEEGKRGREKHGWYLGQVANDRKVLPRFSSRSVEWSPDRLHHNLGPPARKPPDAAVSRSLRNDEKTSTSGTPQDPWSNAVAIISTNSRWPGEMAVPLIRRETPHHAPNHPHSHLRAVTIPAAGQHLHRTCRYLIHHSPCPLLHRECGRRNITV